MPRSSENCRWSCLGRVDGVATSGIRRTDGGGVLADVRPRPYDATSLGRGRLEVEHSKNARSLAVGFSARARAARDNVDKGNNGRPSGGGSLSFTAQGSSFLTGFATYDTGQHE